MSDTSLQTALPPPSITPAPQPPAQETPRDWKHHPAYKALWAVASLRLTVALFVLSLLLVFFGTLAQVDRGIWSVVSDYFRAFAVWIPFQLIILFCQKFFWFPHSWEVPGAFPFPGGWTLGIVLLLNLVAAHIVRFKVGWKRAGILLIHGGLIVLMLGEFVTGLFAVEGNMTIDENRSTNYVEHTRYMELSFTRPSATEKDKDDVTVIPDGLLRGKKLISPDDLPFDIQPVSYMVNSGLEGVSDREDALPATRGNGLSRKAVKEPEISGTDTKQGVDLASCYVQFLDKNGNDKGTHLFSLMLKPYPVEIDGKTYQVALRFKRTYKPYRIHLIKFQFERYMGTNTPKDYSSDVRVIDEEEGVDRRVLIRMNEPLRYRGDALFQSSFKPSETTTILQVVTNPGWLMPYISCSIVSVGLLIHFILGLTTFLRRRTTP